MATLVLTAAVSSIGLSGFSLFAAQLAATAVGSFIDSRLFSQSQSFSSEGPRLNEISISSSSEGQPIKRLFGRARLGSNLIWVTNYTETVTTDTQRSGGKGGGAQTTTTTTTYNYSISFAVAFCQGNDRTQLGDVYADGKLIDLSTLNYEFYPGSDTQGPDPTIEGVEGTGNVPGFRGTCYMVFTDMPLETYGNRMPQITAEIIKPLDTIDPNSMEGLLQGINLIPATGEAAYSTVVQTNQSSGNSTAANAQAKSDTANIVLALERLGVELPSLGGVNLVVSQFGTDLRCNSCQIEPRVEFSTNRILSPQEWSCQGLSRSQVNEVSRDSENRPSYGGTPADYSVVQSSVYIADTLGKNVLFYPFVLMDIPEGNGLPDPYGGSEQGSYPWRGRITVSDPNTIDKTPAAATEISAFFGSAAIGDFNVSGTNVVYTGNPADFGYRRFCLFYAHLFAAAANSASNPTRFKAFYIGSEMVGLTRIRSTASGTATASTTYPAVDAFSQLITDVQTIFTNAGRGNIEISYAADWSEYKNHVPTDGSSDVYFNMDKIWANPDCDYVSIDNYMKLSDWRDGRNQLDYGTGTNAFGNPQGLTVCDPTYLKGQIEGGEDYDYFYASQSDRDAQIRTPISDGAYSEPEVFRQKDIRYWWENDHLSRPGGVRDASAIGVGGGPTFTPGSKRVVFSECGAPSVNKGTNQPNVFFDPKSSESQLPYYSNGRRDDAIQRVYYESLISYWTDNSPTTPITMISPADIYGWTWDARPYPQYPERNDVWSDGSNYQLGHWLNGRAGAITLANLIKEVCSYGGLTTDDIDVTGIVSCNTVIRGYVIDAINSPREMLNPLNTAYSFDGFESEGKVKFRSRAFFFPEPLSLDSLVTDNKNVGGYSITRAQETELPAAARVAFIDEANAYQPGATGGRKVVGRSLNVIELRFPIVMDQEYARNLGDLVIQEAWSARDRMEMALPPSFLKYDPMDGFDVNIKDREFDVRITRISRSAQLDMSLETLEPTVYDSLSFSGRGNPINTIPTFGQTELRFLDLPLVTGEETFPWAPRVAAFQNPFPSAVNVLRNDGGLFQLYGQALVPALIGETTSSFPATEPWKFDRTSTLQLKVFNPDAILTSEDEAQVLAGANALALLTPAGTWEVIQFVNAVLTGDDDGFPLYDITGILRGQLGTETEIADPLPSGSTVVALTEESIVPLSVPEGQKFFEINYRYGPAELDVNGTTWQDATHTGQAVGLLPYAPAQLRKKPTPGGTGEVTFTWIRRTRFGGDDFDEELTPLNEEIEAYDLEIYDPSGPTLRRSLVNLTSAEYTYTVADQTTDGGILTSYLIRVWQKSTSVGRGRQAEATL